MMTGQEFEQVSQGLPQTFDPLALCQTDEDFEEFGSFWIAEQDENKAKSGENTEVFPVLEENGEMMAGWQALLTQVNLAAENTVAFQCGPPSVSSTVSTSGDVAGFSEYELRTLSVKDLNRAIKTKGLTTEQVQMVKQRRRTIKNRGYAQDCRKKRIKVKESLETTNSKLLAELALAREQIATLTRERDVYRSNWEVLQQKIEQSGLENFFSLGAL